MTWLVKPGQHIQLVLKTMVVNLIAFWKSHLIWKRQIVNYLTFMQIRHQIFISIANSRYLKAKTDFARNTVAV
jgi:hypothetical protein